MLTLTCPPPCPRIIVMAMGMLDGIRSGERTDTADERRFLALVERHDSTISALCFHYAGTAAEYDDLRQDALLNLWRGLAGFRGDAAERTWIYRVVLNSCVTTLRRNSRHPRASEADMQALCALIDEPDDKRERVETLHSLIARLNVADRAIILMWLDEASYDEIATVMGLPRATVATRIHRIKSKLSKLHNDDNR